MEEVFHAATSFATRKERKTHERYDKKNPSNDRETIANLTQTYYRNAGEALSTHDAP